MESLGNLNKFFTALCNFSQLETISLIGRLPPDTSEDLNKIKPRWRYLAYDVLKSYGRVNFLRSIAEKYKNVEVKEIRIITFQGLIRVSNPDYLQNQITTKRVLGLPIDLMPRKRRSLLDCEKQLVVISEYNLNRYGSPKYGKPFLTLELKKNLDAFNIRNRRIEKSSNLSRFAQAFADRNSIQAEERISNGTGETLRPGGPLDVPVVADEGLFPF